MPRTILTFESVRVVIKADQLLRHHQLVVKIIPVPEHISSECGMCLETNDQTHERIHKILNNNHIKHRINLIT